MDHSDFAVLNDAGQVEDYGNWERLEDTVKSTQRPLEGEFSLENGGGGGGPTTLMLFNIFTPGTLNSMVVFYHGYLRKSVCQNFTLNMKPTYLSVCFLDEVDFLSALVGEEAVQELKDDVDREKEHQQSEQVGKYISKMKSPVIDMLLIKENLQYR